MGRCDRCARFAVEEIRNGMRYFHPNLRSLRDSAAAGCDMCHLCWTCLRNGHKAEDIDAVLAGKCPSYDGGQPLYDERVWLEGYFVDEFRAHAIKERDRAEKASGPIPTNVVSSTNGSQIEVGCGHQKDPEKTFGGFILGGCLGVFADPGTPAAHRFIERCITVDRNPRGHVEFARGMVALCKKRHPECGNASEDRNLEMPTRVIDVGTGPGEAKLVNALDRGIREPYVALSYCWGQGVRHATELNDRNYSSLLEYIDETKLTTAHLECMQVAREFGIRYVWIDSLCIIQGNRADWDCESRKMVIVYGNATLTVIAARSVDSREGFIANRLKHAAPPVPLPVGLKDENGKDMGDIYLYITRRGGRGPLNKRGWCFQEAVLSRRKLIFEHDTLIFSCQRHDYREFGRLDPSAKLRSKLFQGFKLSDHGNSCAVDKKGREQMRADILGIWYKTILWDYTIRLLTNPYDIFAALSGIAQLAQMSIRSRYLAGIWEVDMVRGLLWHTSFSYGMRPKRDFGTLVSPLAIAEPIRPLGRDGKPVVRAPSWSWASIQGQVHERVTSRDEYMLKDPSNYLIRPKSSRPGPQPESFKRYEDEPEIPSWTALVNPDCDADVLDMPYCELCFFGRPKKVRCSKWTDIPGFAAKWEAPRSRKLSLAEQGYMVLLEPAQSEYAQLADLGLLLVQNAPSITSPITGDNSVVISPTLVFAEAFFDVLEEGAGITECWFLPVIKEKWRGLLLRKDPSDGKFRRLGMVSVSKKELFSWLLSGPEEEIHLV
ncbi:HET-domain-containing protein [Rostrohypoxylon terebratum]|nr:HET-domain-containing protein [Rostrohypoxylon terebratum]